MAQEKEVTRALYKRVGLGKTRNEQETIKAQGVLHVDFLPVGKTWFRGLVRSGNNWDTMRLITG